MQPDVSGDAAEYQRRARAASVALNSAEQAVAMAQLVAQAQGEEGAGGSAIAGGERLRSAKRVGLLASSMNPLTRAHVALADSARQHGRLDALAWVATAVTVDKEQVERASLADRLLQTRSLAVATGDGLLLLKGGLYVEQARAAHALLGPDAEVALIVGFDKVAQIFDPRYYADRDAALRELFSEAELIAAPRADGDEADLRALLGRPENRTFATRVRFCPLPSRYLNDSSSQARALAAAGRFGEPLHALLAPEGLALAEVACPYAPARPASANDLGDSYAARQTLLAALGGLPPAALAGMPPLGDLVAWCAEASARGVALRAWARAGGRRTLEGLRAALAAE